MPDLPPSADNPSAEGDPDDRSTGAGSSGLPPEIEQMLARLTGGPVDPEMAKALQGMGIDKVDPAMLELMTGQMQAMFATSTDAEPINVSLATDTARRTVGESGDPSVGDAARRQLAQAAQVAELWLDEVTAFEAPGITTHAWSRAEWVEATMPAWRTLVEPVAEGVGRAIGDAMRTQLQQLGEGALPEGLLPAGMDPAQLLGQMEPMLERMSGSMFGLQVGQAVGALASETVSGTEVGLPLVADRSVALLPANVEAFADGLAVDLEQVRLYLCAREAARVRLFSEVPWLGPQLMAAVRDYARDISIDTDRIESALQSVDPSDVNALQSALQDQLFRPDPSATQRAALVRLETYLALVEGWVDVVADRATRNHLPQSAALGEAVRRRRATGGPAEKVFAGLVGLELRPRRLRDAANLWAALEARHGQDARDAAWGHPDVAPTAADLDDPLAYVDRVGTSTDSDLDAALDELLNESGGSDGEGGRSDGEGGYGESDR
ncbi:zinc-dependent metalloprotease [Pedococcus sp. 5OH_020]|uniref:zinc-dependent metalloprotease n=1 Tax=Pedococcus sp. 5OH_020 TaxID=2989814 RepID=UPI0022E9C622|nr:zinc-dependent metalloprotease [Pedococcus sp. 5OH_020]